MSIAYWGPEIHVGVPQPALNFNMDAHTNVESLSFTFNNESATMPVVFIQNQLTKIPIPIPIPNVSLLNPPLGLIPPIPKNIEPLNGHRQTVADQRRAVRADQGGQVGGRGDRHGIARCAALRPGAQGAAAWWGCAARARPSTGCTTSRA